MSETIDAEIVDEMAPGQALVVSHGHPPAPVTLFGTDDPAGVVRRATEAAKPLADVVRKQKLATNIHGREHVRVEGWTLLGSMLGVFPVCTWTRKLEDGWEARVEARTRDGSIVGAAEAECLRSESTWKSRDDYALRSMAQTRATSKALRQPLGFVMQLAGFDPTPAEEMPRDSARRGAAAQPGGTPEEEKTDGGSASSSGTTFQAPEGKRGEGKKATQAEKNKLTAISIRLGPQGAQMVTEDHIVAALGFAQGVPFETAREQASQDIVRSVIERLETFEKNETSFRAAPADETLPV